MYRRSGAGQRRREAAKGVDLRTKVMLSVVVLALVATGVAAADSTPAGPLPKPAVTRVTTAKGSLVAVALPTQTSQVV